jgi:hypothetical protein
MLQTQRQLAEECILEENAYWRNAWEAKVSYLTLVLRAMPALV